MIERIAVGIQTLAIIIRSSYRKEGTEFFTPGDFSQQLRYMKRPKGDIVLPHTRQHIERKVFYTQEVLLVRSGKVRVDFYNHEQEVISSSIILRGDVILLAYGGHGFEFLEDAELIEIKQGPYQTVNDKVRFAGAVSLV